MPNLHRMFLAIALLFSCCAAASSGEPVVEFDRWYQVRLADQHSGWLHATVTRIDGSDARIESASEFHVTLSRGEISLEIGLRTLFSETPDGKPLRAVVIQQLGRVETEQEMLFKPEGVEIVSRQSGQELRKTVPVSPADREWLTPAAAQRLVEQKLAAGEKEIRWWSVDPSAGPRRFETTLKIEGKKNIELMGKVVPALVASQTMSITPGVVAQAFLDEKGQPLKSSIAMIPGMPLEVIATDRELAMAKVKPKEMMAGSFVKPDKPIDRPRELRMAIYELTFEDAKAPDKIYPTTAAANNSTSPERDAAPALSRAGYQRVVWGDSHSASVAVDLDEPVNPVDDLPKPEHRAATQMLNFADPAVRVLVEKALNSQPADLSPRKKAELLRQFVHTYIKTKALSVGFATASEVARTAEGDCTEHGVLLAALLRGAGIPSRTVTGLIYVEEFLDHESIFGYHMWAQAWIGKDADGGGGHWIDLDAVLPEESAFDAAHIAITTSSMADGEMVNDMFKLFPLFGRLKIRVVDATPPAQNASPAKRAGATRPAE